MSGREEKAWRHYKARNTLRQVRKEIKRGCKPKRVRRRDWLPDDLDNLEAWDYEQSERVMPRGEQERRRAMWSAALDRLENEAAAGNEALPAAELDGVRGRVVEVSSGLCRVDIEGRGALCTWRGILRAKDSGFTNVVAVGDQVLVSLGSAERGVVEAVLPRRSALVRPDVFYGHLQQVVVANVDQVLVVTSWRNPAIWLELVDRYLIAAERNQLAAVVCVNKVDLAKDRATCQAALQPYVALGYRLLFTSALTGEGIHELRELLRERMTVLAGLSGVGKSSLLAAVQPGLQLRTSEINERRHEGRHTTTQVTMHRLEMGGAVVDTPGIREFGLSGLRRADLVRFYPEILAVTKACQFTDCSHRQEPGCAARAAVRQGVVSSTRYHNYKKIYDSLPA